MDWLLEIQKLIVKYQKEIKRKNFKTQDLKLKYIYSKTLSNSSNAQLSAIAYLRIFEKESRLLYDNKMTGYVQWPNFWNEDSDIKLIVSTLKKSADKYMLTIKKMRPNTRLNTDTFKIN